MRLFVGCRLAVRLQLFLRAAPLLSPRPALRRLVGLPLALSLLLQVPLLSLSGRRLHLLPPLPRLLVRLPVPCRRQVQLPLGRRSRCRPELRSAHQV